jgi:hypothetical protein
VLISNQSTLLTLVGPAKHFQGRSGGDFTMLLPRISDGEFLIRFAGQTGRVSDVPFARAVGKRFSIALTNELELVGLQPITIAIRADLFKEKRDNRTVVNHIKLDITAKIPHATYGQFIDATLAAKAKCLLDLDRLSKISINAQLEESDREGAKPA